MSSSSFFCSPYQSAARILNQIWESGKTLRTFAFKKTGETSQLTCSKAVYAQVCHVLDAEETLTELLRRVPFPDVRNLGLLYVLTYELLMGPNKAIRGGGRLKRCLVEQRDKLATALDDIEKDSPSLQRHQQRRPRYVRVNTCRNTSAEEVVEKLRQTGVEAIYFDADVPDLLVLPANSTAKVLNLGHDIVLQDKASCFPAFCLLHGYKQHKTLMGESCDWLDACAAPGNKTSHLAALLRRFKATGTLFAFDRDEERHKLLEKRMRELVPSAKNELNVQTAQQDFLQVEPNDFPQVFGILLDPSCSGSGIHKPSTSISSSSSLQPPRRSTDKRLVALANFQLQMLRHAAKFPGCRRIVYSTCSIHPDENEDVITRFLESDEEGWKVIAPECLQQWPNRGLGDDVGRKMLRAVGDETHGFFVCCLHRRMDDDEVEKEDCLAVPIPKSSHVVPIYNGQLRNITTTEDKQNRAGYQKGQADKKGSTQKKTAHDGKTLRNKATAPNHQKQTSNTDSSQKSAKHSTAEPSIHDRKRAKKRAWNERQSKAKAKRKRLPAKLQSV